MSKYFIALQIEEIRDETSEAYTIRLRPENPDWLSYQAGQYLTVKIVIDGTEYRRAYSLSSSPLVDEQLCITIKRVEGGKVSNYLRDHVRVGDRLEVMRPMGGFVFVPEVDRGRCYVLIGGGSGITPLMSILATILHGEPLSVVYLWYGNRTSSSIIFREELERLRHAYDSRLFIRHSLTQPPSNWSGPSGRLDKNRIYSWISDLFMTDEHRKQYYLCGPAGLMDAAEHAFDLHAVNPSDVHREWFAAPVPTEAEFDKVYREEVVATETSTPPETAHDITLQIQGEEHLLTVKPGQSILDAAIEANLDPPYACMAGICSSCMAKLVSGEVRMEETTGLSQVELDEGYILSCQAHPVTDDVSVRFE
ncbi:MAG: ferredoxin--NADP reductase [Bacteroidota bacterium]